MAYQPILIGAANAKAGDTLFDGATKINANFAELYDQNLSSTIVANQSNLATTLGGTIDSTKVYVIDGTLDFTGTGLNIEVPAGGINMVGSTFDISKIICSDINYTLFTSSVGGSGNILGIDYAIEVTGSGSRVYNLTDATGFNAFEFSRINYNDCSSLGEITNYRQGLESGTGRFGGKPELTLSGTWFGGYFIDTSIVRGMVDGAYSLFKEGTAFTMASRFRSNMNIDLPASASFFDFVSSNFINPSTLNIEGAIVTRNGVFNATDANISPNITASNLVSAWTGNNGMPNTFEGGSIGVTTEVATTITTSAVFVDLEATLWTAADLQHFDNPTKSLLRHLGNTPREYKIIADFALDSTANDTITLRVTKWDDSASVFTTVLDQTRQVNNLVGGRDVAFFNININTELDQDDYIKLEVANIGATNDVTAEVDSYYIIEAR
jgi:hypothetical protein